jgi:hypothetical protein
MSGLRGLGEFQAAFDEYLRWNQRGQGELVADRGKKVSIAIYKIYRKQAEPNKAALREKIFAQEGYEIKRRLRRDGSGKSIPWAQEVNLRASGVAVLATSWLHNRWRKNNAVGRYLRVNRRRRRMGEAIVDAAPGNTAPSVKLITYLDGAVALNQQRALVSQALFYQAADMRVYTARKHQEWIASRLIGDFRTEVTV